MVNCCNNCVYASGVALTSNRDKKKNIEDYTESALSEICTTPIRKYHLEDDLDNVAEGKLVWNELLKKFYDLFEPRVESAFKEMEKKAPVETGETCPECGNDRATYKMLQTRSADEAPTRIFTCTKCKHTWRAYH